MDAEALMKGPSQHLSWNELACWNRLGQKFMRWAPGQLISAYPAKFREDRAVLLATTFEDIRLQLGADPIFITSAFRTPAYNAAVGGAFRSQHVEGRALDIRHSRLRPRTLYAEILRLYHRGYLPLLGGLGSYETFVHIDVRPKTTDYLATF